MKHVIGVAACLVLLLTGCQHIPLEMPHPARPGLVIYAEQIAELSPEAQSQRLAMAREAYKKAQTPVTHAHLGLCLGVPGYQGYDPDAALKHLKAALDQPAADWSARQQAFLSLRIQQIQRLAAAQQAQRELTREKRHLRQALEEARDKLQAITEIEQDIGPHTRHR